AEVVVDGSGSEHQIVVRHGSLADVYGLLLERDTVHLAEDDERVALSAEDHADRLRDIGRSERGACHLIEQRLEQVIVVAIDDDQLDGRAAQGARRPQAPEAASDDDHTGLSLARAHESGNVRSSSHTRIIPHPRAATVAGSPRDEASGRWVPFPSSRVGPGPRIRAMPLDGASQYSADSIVTARSARSGSSAPCGNHGSTSGVQSSRMRSLSRRICVVPDTETKLCAFGSA